MSGFASDPAVRDIVVRFCRQHALSEREGQVLGHAATGRSTKEIAWALQCSASAVQTYWGRIIKKTAYGCRAEVLAGLLQESTRTKPAENRENWENQGNGENRENSETEEW
jgi:DNA-binding CsgD family transcriptional regulator